MKRPQAKPASFGKAAWLPTQARRAVGRAMREHALCPHLLTFYGCASPEEEAALRRDALPAFCLGCRRQVFALFMRLAPGDPNLGRIALAEYPPHGGRRD